MVKIIAVAVIRKSVSEVMIRPFSVKCQERQRDREGERELLMKYQLALW